MKKHLFIRFLFAWYDIWVGVFVDRKKKRVYVFPVPCLGFYISWDHKGKTTITVGKLIVTFTNQPGNAPFIDSGTSTVGEDGAESRYSGKVILLTPWRRKYGQSLPQPALVVGWRVNTVKVLKNCILCSQPIDSGPAHEDCVTKWHDRQQIEREGEKLVGGSDWGPLVKEIETIGHFTPAPPHPDTQKLLDLAAEAQRTGKMPDLSALHNDATHCKDPQCDGKCGAKHNIGE